MRLPGALRDGTDHGAHFGEFLLMGGVRCLGEFPVGFVLVVVQDELVEEMVQLPGGGVGEDATSKVTV